MTKEELVQTVKSVLATARAGDVEGSYRGYRDLYSAPDFTALRPEDQRQALKLLVMTKKMDKSSVPLKEALQAAMPPLTDLVSRHNEPEDFEMLGICHLLAGNEEGASSIFRAGLQIERERTPGSELCGRLMTRISSI